MTTLDDVDALDAVVRDAFARTNDARATAKAADGTRWPVLRVEDGGMEVHKLQVLLDEQGYYSGEEDAYDMRKACSRDVERKSIVPLPHAVHPDDVD